MKRKIIAFLTLFFCLASSFSTCAATVSLDEAYEKTAEYILEKVPSPAVSSVGGEWAVVALARGGAKVPGGYYNIYINAVESLLKKNGGTIDERKLTESSRVIIALTAVGANPESISGYNLVSSLNDYDNVVRQGLNGAVWALISANCGGYNLANDEKYLNYILASQNSDGGFSLNVGGQSDVDITAMAIQALSFYSDTPNASAAIEKSLLWLSSVQLDNGGFNSYGTSTSESCSQVITALCSVKTDISDARFIKDGNTVFDALLNFRLPDGGFAHISGDKISNLMATEQALYAIASLKRQRDGKNALYNMADAENLLSEENKSPSSVKIPEKTFPKKIFADTASHPNASAIEELTERGIINGKTEALFEPDATMTRAEFSAVIVRALSLTSSGEKLFDDVSENDWYFDYVSAASTRQIVNGISEKEFNPLGTVTKEEAAVMVARSAKLLGANTEIYEPRDILAQFTDYTLAGNWAWEGLAFCCEYGVLSTDEAELKPKKEITRAEIAQMIFNMIQEASR